MPLMPAHDWFRPKLVALLAEAEQAGFAGDVAEAVITDLINGELSAGVAVAAPDENWARDIGEPAEISNEMPGKESLPPETQGDGQRSDNFPDFPGQIVI
jgi:hypothetical protein